jgi:hypothetical protein
MLMSTLAQHPQPLQPGADLGPGFERLLRQVVAQRAVGEAELEVVDQLGVIQAAALQVALRLGALFQLLVVVRDHLPKQRLVLGVGLDHQPGLQRLHRGGRRRHLGTATQPLDRMAEAHPLFPHHPIHHAAAGAARAQAVPEVLLRRDHQRGLAVVVEGAQAQEVRAVTTQHHAALLDQRRQVRLALDALDLFVGDAGHGNRLRS